MALMRRFQALLVLVCTTVLVFLASLHKTRPTTTVTKLSPSADLNVVVGQRLSSDDRVETRVRRSSSSRGLNGCFEECRRFHVLLENWPVGKPKAAIYVLTKGSRMQQFVTMLSSLDRYFNRQYEYPIIVFHEREYVHRRGQVRNSTSSMVFFQEISFSIPEFLIEPVKLNIPCISSISYRHMCRFHAKGVFEEPIVQDLQYYWRLDDDSLLLEEVAYDVFRYMHDHQLLYGYIWRHVDAFECVEGLWETTQKYIASTNLTTYAFDTWKEPWLYYNNFEISAMSPWMMDVYSDYINYIDRVGGIYYHRWGDAPIRGLSVAMFIETSRVHCFSDISYRHGGFIHKKS